MPVRRAGDEVVRDQVDLLRHQPGHAAQRDVLGERHRVLLDVRAVRAGLRAAGRAGQPHDGCVAIVGSGAFEHRADEDRCTDGVRRVGDLRGRVRVARVVGDERVDVAGVLRPDHDVRFRGSAGRDLGGEGERGPHVVVEHGAALRVEFETEPRHVALHDRDLDRPAVRSVQRHGEAERDDREPGDRDADGRDRTPPDRPGAAGRIRSPDPAEPTRLDDAPRGQREQSAAQRHRERDERRPTERGEPQRGRVALAEREPAPRKAAERNPVAQGLLTHPEHAGRERPHPAPPVDQRAGVGRQRPGERDEDRLRGRENEPGAGAADDVRPLDQRHEEQQSGEAGEPEAAPERPPVDGDGDRRDRERREPPQVGQREGHQQAATRGDGQQDSDDGRHSAGRAAAADADPRPVRSDPPIRHRGAVGAATTPVPPSASRSRAAVPVVELFVTAQLCLIEAECGVPRSTSSVLSVSSTARVARAGPRGHAGNGIGVRPSRPHPELQDPLPPRHVTPCSATFGPTRGELAAHPRPLSTGRPTLCRNHAPRPVRITPADPHPLGLAGATSG